MSFAKSSMTTKEFAREAGVSTSTVLKWLRGGKIEGQKKSGKWVIPPTELAKIGARQQADPAPAPKIQHQPSPSPTKAGKTVYSIKQFSAMTYLTEFGVEKWLKEGRLTRAVDENGNSGVSATNLDDPLVQRLIR